MFVTMGERMRIANERRRLELLQRRIARVAAAERRIRRRVRQERDAAWSFLGGQQWEPPPHG